jgi:hypothetical protein
LSWLYFFTGAKGALQDTKQVKDFLGIALHLPNGRDIWNGQNCLHKEY